MSHLGNLLQGQVAFLLQLSIDLQEVVVLGLDRDCLCLKRSNLRAGLGLIESLGVMRRCWRSPRTSRHAGGRGGIRLRGNWSLRMSGGIGVQEDGEDDGKEPAVTGFHGIDPYAAEARTGPNT